MKLIEKVSVYSSSLPRFERANDLLKGKRKIDEFLIKDVFHDHGTENVLSEMTICMHCERFGTWRSMIMYPKRRAMKLLFGHPCVNDYQEIKFS
jgi:hypothetical protein